MWAETAAHPQERRAFEPSAILRGFGPPTALSTRGIRPELREHAIGPAKSKLQLIFASAATTVAALLRPLRDVVLLHQHARV